MKKSFLAIEVQLKNPLENPLKTNRGRKKTFTASRAVFPNTDAYSAYGNLKQSVHAHTGLQGKRRVSKRTPCAWVFLVTDPGNFNVSIVGPNTRDKKALTFTFTALQPPNSQDHSFPWISPSPQTNPIRISQILKFMFLIQPKVLP